MGEGWPTKRKRIGMSVSFFAALVAFAGTLSVVVLYKPGVHTSAELSRLEKGMTEDEVRAVLGEPFVGMAGTVTPGDTEALWTYSLPASHWSVSKQDYQLKFFHGKLDTWWKVKIQ